MMRKNTAPSIQRCRKQIFGCLSPLIGDPPDAEVGTIGDDFDFGVVAFIGEHRKDITGGELIVGVGTAIDGRVGVDELPEIRQSDLGEVNKAYIDKRCNALGIQGAKGAAVDVPVDITSTVDLAAGVKVESLGGLEDGIP